MQPVDLVVSLALVDEAARNADAFGIDDERRADGDARRDGDASLISMARSISFANSHPSPPVLRGRGARGEGG